MHLAQVNIHDIYFGNHPGASIIGNDLGTMISYFLPNAMAIAGVIFFLMILFGGFTLIFKAGSQGSAQDATKAKNTITFGVIGFLIVISAYFILQILSTILGIDLIHPQP